MPYNAYNTNERRRFDTMTFNKTEIIGTVVLLSELIILLYGFTKFLMAIV